MRASRINAHVEVANYANTVRIYLWTDLEDGKRGIAQPLEMKVVGLDEHFAPPFIEEDQTFAQVLINELWRVGFRPTELGDSRSTSEAMKAHLEDMRRIAFKFLEP